VSETQASALRTGMDLPRPPTLCVAHRVDVGQAE